jgi:hypothetical protein
MTRARDELILSHAPTTAAHGRGACRRSCSRRSTCRRAGAAGAGAGDARRWTASRPSTRPPSRRRPRGPIEEPLSLSFYQVDDYLTCPLKYKYAHVLRVPLAPHHAIVYGAALHKAVQFPSPPRRGHVMSDPS